MSGESHYEQYEFHCRPCNYVWQKTYEVRGADTAPHHYFYVSGLPASPPLAGRRCPNCWEPTYAAGRVEAPPALADRRHAAASRRG
jgi:hypothetical protein